VTTTFLVSAAPAVVALVATLGCAAGLFTFAADVSEFPSLLTVTDMPYGRVSTQVLVDLQIEPLALVAHTVKV
jgi:hypothetical protein